MLTDVLMTPMMLGWQAGALALQQTCAQAGILEPFAMAEPDLRIPRADVRLALSGIKFFSAPENFFPPAVSPSPISLSVGKLSSPTPLRLAPPTDSSAPIPSKLPDDVRQKIVEILKALEVKEKKIPLADIYERLAFDPFFQDREEWRLFFLQAALEDLLAGKQPIDPERYRRLTQSFAMASTTHIPVDLSSLLQELAEILRHQGFSREQLSQIGLLPPAGKKATASHPVAVLPPAAPPPAPTPQAKGKGVVGLDPARLGISLKGSFSSSTSRASAASIEAVRKVGADVGHYDLIVDRFKGPLPNLVDEQGRLLLAVEKEDGTLEPIPDSGLGETRFLSSGGMGMIFVVKKDPDPKVEDVPSLPLVAKIPLSRFAHDPRILGRFVIEQWVGEILGHPNILPALSRSLQVRRTQDGRPVIFMHYQRGFPGDPRIKTLRDLIGSISPLPIDLVVESVFLPMSDALVHAHANGVIHRDLKPDNIIIDHVNDRPVFKLMDFGVALLSGLGAPNFDVPGSASGTLGYMSQKAREGRPDPSVDVFALGVVAYEALTGIHPMDATKDFTGDEKRDALPIHWLNQVPPPRQLRDGIPEELEKIVLKAMGVGQVPYQTASQLKDALLKFVEAQKAKAEARPFLEEGERLRTAAFSIDPEKRYTVWKQLMTQAVAQFEGALQILGKDLSVHNQLGQLYLLLFLEEEKRGTQEVYEGILEARFPKQASVIRAKGHLAVTWKGAESPRATLVSFEDRGGFFLESKEEPVAGENLFKPFDLAGGYYALRVEAEGFVPMQFPFLVRRTETTKLLIRLYRLDEVPAGYAVIPPGPVVMDINPTHYAATPQKVEEITYPFAVKPTLVTRREYIEFLNGLIEEGRVEEALARLPRTGKDQFLWHQETIDAIRRGESIGEVIYFAKTGSPERADRVVMEAPILWISHDDAAAWAAWAFQKDGFERKLPTRLEWLRIARGNDARLRPWGDGEYIKDAANVSEPDSLEERFLSPVGEYYFDRSPFSHPERAIVDVFGNAREYTKDEATDPSDARRYNISVGSGFIQEAEISIMKRYKFEPHRPLSHGFRVVYRLPR